MLAISTSQPVSLAYLYSRGISLKPIVSAKSIYGYLYPIVDVHFSNEDYRMFEILDFLECQRILKGSFVDKTHFCNFCHSSFINFREICPHCMHADLKTEDIVHHFKCGYIGPESDYKNGIKHSNQLFCPKCHNFLKHIGVDYDRPSVVNECNQCQRSFQEPDVDCVCINCGKKTVPENLILKKIKEYRITPIGERAVIANLQFSTSDLVKKSMDVMPLETFEIIVDLEIKRHENVDSPRSRLAIILIENFSEIYVKLGKRSNEVISEFGSIIKNLIRTTDVVSVLDDSSFIIFFPDAERDAVISVLDDIATNIRDLLNANLEIETSAPFYCLDIVETLIVKDAMNTIVGTCSNRYTST